MEHVIGGSRLALVGLRAHVLHVGASGIGDAGAVALVVDVVVVVGVGFGVGVVI